MSVMLLEPLGTDDRPPLTPIVAPATAVASPDTYYMVFVYWMGGDIAPERSAAAMLSREVTVNDIISFELDGVTRVIEFSPSLGVCKDVTKDIALSVITKLRDDLERPNFLLRSWLHDVLGVSRAEEALAYDL